MNVCKVDGCGKTVHAQGLCNTHYKNARKTMAIDVTPRGLPSHIRLKNGSKFNAVTGCVEWMRNKNVGGYGLIRVGSKMMVAHRLAWESANGPIPDGLQALHHCDNRSCINPEHLFLGTQQDNMDDKCAKGRQFFAKGERNGHAKLSDGQIREIRDDARLHREIARDYGVCRTLVTRIKGRVIWSHVA